MSAPPRTLTLQLPDQHEDPAITARSLEEMRGLWEEWHAAADSKLPTPEVILVLRLFV